MPSPGERKKTPDEIRLLMQAEMTLLGWVRTCLGLMGFGFVVARFGLFLRELAEADQIHVKRHAGLALFSSVTGLVLIVLGVVVLLAAVFLHRRFVQALERGDPDVPTGWSLGILLSLAMAALGVALAGYLAVAEF